jgi:hypothetical protein
MSGALPLEQVRRSGSALKAHALLVLAVPNAPVCAQTATAPAASGTRAVPDEHRMAMSTVPPSTLATSPLALIERARRLPPLDSLAPCEIADYEKVDALLQANERDINGPRRIGIERSLNGPIDLTLIEPFSGETTADGLTIGQLTAYCPGSAGPCDSTIDFSGARASSFPTIQPFLGSSGGSAAQASTVNRGSNDR